MTTLYPRVSIIVAVYNRRADIDGCLDSVATQDYPNLELVVVDGNSSDGTAELLRERAAEISHLHIGPDDGIYDAWNTGIALATGEWVHFLGSDDRLDGSGAISRLVEATRTAPTANLVSGRAIQLHPDGTRGAVIGTPWNARKMRLCMCIAHPAALTSMNLLKAHGPFSTTVGVAADYDLYLRASHDVRAVDLPEVITLFSVGGITSTDIRGVLRSTRRVQAAHPRIGRVRAAVQYAGFHAALPVREWLRRRRAASTSKGVR